MAARDYYCKRCLSKFDIVATRDSKGTQAPVRGKITFCPNCGLRDTLVPILKRDLQDFFDMYAFRFNKPAATIKLLYQNWQPPPFGEDEPDFKIFLEEILEPAYPSHTS